MAKRKPKRPTAAELQILRVLWDRGPSTVREVHESLNAKRSAGYTTTLKFLQIMIEKGLVTRDESHRSHVYSAKRGKEDTQRALVSDLLERAFDGSAQKLVLQALSTEQASAEDLAEIRQLLDKLATQQGARKKKK